MKYLVVILALLMWTAMASGAVYKWVDDKGTVHFSDKPAAPDAQKVEIRGTGITVQPPEGAAGQGPQGSATAGPAKPAAAAPPAGPATEAAAPQKKVISAADYRISSSVGKLGADVISISGRIGSGPVCRDMLVTATARNENGLSATITQRTSKSTSHGSTLFEGTAKAVGSRDDMSFWKVESVTVRCDDP